MPRTWMRWLLYFFSYFCVCLSVTVACFIILDQIYRCRRIHVYVMMATCTSWLDIYMVFAYLDIWLISFTYLIKIYVLSFYFWLLLGCCMHSCLLMFASVVLLEMPRGVIHFHVNKQSTLFNSTLSFSF